MVTKHVKIIETYTDSDGNVYDNCADAIRAERISNLRSIDIDWSDVTPEVIADNCSEVIKALSFPVDEAACS